MRIDVEKIDDTNETWSMPSQRALQPAVPLVLEPQALAHDTILRFFLAGSTVPLHLANAIETVRLSEDKGLGITSPADSLRLHAAFA